jgi:hypothetical protein
MPSGLRMLFDEHSESHQLLAADAPLMRRVTEAAGQCDVPPDDTLRELLERLDGHELTSVRPR